MLHVFWKVRLPKVQRSCRALACRDLKNGHGNFARTGRSPSTSKDQFWRVERPIKPSGSRRSYSQVHSCQSPHILYDSTPRRYEVATALLKNQHVFDNVICTNKNI